MKVGHPGWIAILGFVAACMTLLAAILGFRNADARQEISQVTTVNQDNSALIASLQADKIKLEERNAQLQAENADLGSDVPPNTSTGGGGSAPKTASPAVRHEGRLDVTPRTQAADLDAPASDPGWSREDARSGDGVLDGPYYSGATVNVANSAKHVFRGTAAADYASCAALQTYAAEYIPVGDLFKGANICIKTSAGRFARLTLVEEASAASMTLAVTVWEKT